MASKYEVYSFADASLQEQQTEFVAQPDDTLDGSLDFLLVGIVEVDVHAYGVGRCLAASQQAVLAGYAGIVELGQTPFVFGVSLACALDQCDVVFVVTDRQIVLYGAHGQHHLCSFA